MHRFSPSTGSLRLGYPLSSRSQHVLVLEYDDSIQDDSLFVKKKFEKKGILYDFHSVSSDIKGLLQGYDSADFFCETHPTIACDKVIKGYGNAVFTYPFITLLTLSPTFITLC